MLKKIVVIVLVLLQACTQDLKPIDQDRYDYVKQALMLDAMPRWSFEGRVAITSVQDSWSANIDWQHEPGREVIDLSGPLGQGALLIKLLDGVVSIDDGDGKVERSEDPDAFVMQKLGVFVPVRALAYWVVGVPDPGRDVIKAVRGFEQEGWQVNFKEWQSIGNRMMPRKIDVLKDRVKLKLVFDQWRLGSEKTAR